MGILDDLKGKTLIVNGVPYPDRKNLKVTAPGITASDDPSNEATHLDFSDTSFYLPENYGAVGDGVADDTAAIQTAIDFGKNVRLSSATYRITGTLTLNTDGQIISQVTSTAAAQDRLRFDNPNGRVGYIQTSGTATIYSTSSDERMKELIVDAPPAGAIIDSMRVVSFRWRESGEDVQHGFIAQELVTCAPQAVAIGDDGAEIDRPWGVDGSKLVPLLVRELQELRRRVALLEGK